MQDNFDSAIAVVGMAIRAPGARDDAELWRNLTGGVESITFFSEQELIEQGLPPELVGDPSYVRARGVLDDHEMFDSAFFGIPRHEADLMDPQHRVFLQACYHALEDAGRITGDIGPVDLYAGAGFNSYMHQVVVPQQQVLSPVDMYLMSLGNEHSYIATRTSYRLNLSGASMHVDTACSSGLTAVHMACQSLLSGQSRMAVAGSVSIPVPQRSGYLYQPEGIQAPDGHCRSFDAQAGGFVEGAGVGVVVLRLLEDALEDGDRIRAVIRASAINNDGSAKIGFTAPSVEAQSAVVRDAMALAEVGPEDVDYIEAHGTATRLGDPVEIAALAKAFRGRGTDLKPVYIGSAKSNMGHLGAASGMLGLAKVVLSLENEQLPPSLHYTAPNPEMGIEETPFEVNAELRPWPRGERVRRAGVTSLGMGGTNVHLVLEEAPRTERPRPASATDGADGADAIRLIPLSAKTPEALATLEDKTADALSALSEDELPDFGYTLAVGRQAFGERSAVVVRSATGAAGELRTRGTGYVRGTVSGPKPSVAFLFPGQGAQYAGMTRELYASEPAFREAMDACAAIVTRAGGPDLIEGLYGENTAELNDTRWTQPALFAVGYSLARTWEAWGVRPETMAGNSIGEYVAACLAGVFSLDDALRLVTVRAQLMQELPGGAMLAVHAGAERVRELLDPAVSVAVETSPGHCVISGPHDAVARGEQVLAEAGLRTTPLRTSHAFHSGMMEPVVRRFAAEVAGCALNAPAIPYLSNVTGTWITTAEAMDPEYWARHLCGTVKLADNLTELLADPNRVLVEVGPGSSLSTAAHRCAGAGAADRVIAASLPGPNEDTNDLGHLLRTAGRLWTTGVALDWEQLYDGSARRRTGAPLYPFERRVHWLNTGVEPQRPTAPPVAQEAVPPAGNSGTTEAAPRGGALEQAVLDVVADVAGIAPDDVETDEPLIMQGLDSVLLLQLTHRVKARFGVLVSLSQLLDDVNTPAALAAYLEGRTDIVIAPAPQQAEAAADSGLAAQLAAISAQLKAVEARISGNPTPAATQAAPRTAPSPSPSKAATPSGSLVWGTSDVTGTLTDSWSDEQRANLDTFKRHYLERTGGSREHVRRTRHVHADPRESARFQMAWKDLTYPIVAERTEGARMWDVDGNEYIDLAMGFGVHLFGHRPPFVMRALEEQMARGIHIGPQSDLAGETAALLCTLTGVERAAFCNTGTEAVMTAMRVARAVTGRDKIALFANSYHGTFDGTLARPRAGGSVEAFSGAPGTPRGMISDVLILEYGSDSALELIAQHAHELAAVLIEPVQSRIPGQQLPEFLRQVRKVTEDHDIALIFDEVITGFRLAPGGGQEWAGVRADLVTYGKVLGGGMPLGVIAGRSAYMDAIDGGTWDYGDDSYPMAPQTFFAGTFSKNPLTMAATRAVLKHLIEAGPELQNQLNERTSRLVADLNAFCEAEELPVRLSSCASLFTFHFDPRVTTADLFFHRLVSKGVYVWEGRSCFLSTAHQPEEIAQVTSAVRESLLELRADGFLPAAARPARPTAVPLTQAQQHLWIADQSSEGNSGFNEFLAVRLGGPLDRTALTASLQALIDRHESLRTTFSPQGDVFHVADRATADVRWEEAAPGTTLADVTARHAEYGRTPLDLTTGPLLRVLVTRLGAEEHVLSLVIHHIISDAWSMGVLLRELDELYRHGGDAGTLPPAARFSAYARDLAEWRDSEDGAAAQRYWAARFPDGITALNLPGDFPRDGRTGGTGARRRKAVDGALWKRMAESGARAGATPFMTALAGYQALLAATCEQTSVHVGIHGAGQVDAAADSLVGYCINVLPVGGELDPEESLEALLKRVRDDVTGAFEHRAVPFGGQRSTVGAPVLATAFNLERGGGDGVRIGDLDVSLLPAELPSARWELNLNCIEVGDQLLLEFTYDTGLFRAESVDALLAAYERVLEAIGRGEGVRTEDLLAAARKPAAPAAVGPISGRRRRVVATAPARAALPLVIEAPHGVTDLAAWAGARRDEMRRQVVHHGGLLFRGFGTGIEGFEEFVRTVSGDPLTYQERTSPRHAVHNKVYTSTDFPPDERIYLHNEQSYNVSWPMRIFFHCATAPGAGGQTPIADCRRVYARLSPTTREAFAEHGYLYVRNFRDGLGLSWREAFQTDDRVEVEKYCAQNAIEAEWHGDDLTTRQVRPAVVRHPESGELTWFNHATFFHVSTLPARIRDSLLSGLADSELPNNTYYGDGSPIPAEVLAELRAAYEAETVQFDWERGDVLMLDNMLTAHSRAPFTPPRQIVVAMSEPWSLRDQSGEHRDV